MSTLPSIPSKPPAADGNLGAVLEWCLKKLIQKTDGQLPAQVVSYNRATNTAVVQPLIDMVSTGGQRVTRAQLVSVPVLALGGGGFFVNFPLVPGDLGWIESSDRDISLFLQSMSEAPPNSKRMHSFEDARFVPDTFAKYTFTPAAGAMVVSSLDGTTRVELSTGKIKLVAATVEIDATNLNINASGTGTTVTGNVNLPVGTSINGRNFMTHTHTDPQGGNTGGVN